MAKRKLSEEIKRQIMREMGAKGGGNSRNNMTEAQSSKLGSRAVQIRWARWRRDNGVAAKPGDAELLK